MFCRKCYNDLSDAKASRCPKCGRRFDVDRPRTYLARPFPDRWQIVVQVIATTIFGIFAAFVVAMFQAASASGH